jgi:hypothetical protein
MGFYINEKNLYETVQKADAGDFESQYLVACHILEEMELEEYDDNMVEKAMWYLKNVSINGAYYGLGALKLGDLYFNGNQVQQDYKQAIMWYRTALNSQCTPGYYSLGRCFYYGLGVEQDFAKAFDSFMKGSINADMNHIMLGDMYRMGEFVKRDEEYAVKLYMVAYNDAFETMKRFGQSMGSLFLPSIRLGECYLNGIGVKRNVTEANRYLLQAKTDSKNTVFAKPDAFEKESIRLIQLMHSAPFPEDSTKNDVLDTVELICDSIDVLNLQELSKEELSDYQLEDYLRVYLQSVRRMLISEKAMKKGGDVLFYGNMIISYPNLSCFEYDKMFLDKCERALKTCLNEKSSSDYD